ncbi:hypothetical protein [Paenibacillus sacheonensis]|uniref:Uncharacterized protein n=1 Tax=Paenibacillus sacheonensis TaxID=742054 RepID=A0A7X5C0J0_9BACL|nr:hypothetical protein [Paenibacillus sacheonensis]NBC71596.1 hypothetical protein [Paenibacillus sacheonensis]
MTRIIILAASLSRFGHASFNRIGAAKQSALGIRRRGIAQGALFILFIMTILSSMGCS